MQLSLQNHALLAIDPGVHHYGWALFRTGSFGVHGLHACGLQESKRCVVELPGFDQSIDIVCELPEQRGKGSAVRVADLIDLALAAGRVIGTYTCTFVRPSAWKGQVPKKVQHKRMEEEGLSEGELEYVLKPALASVPRSLRHNVKDAVCLGLVKLGRM
jgi:hypothetical protein